MTVKETSPNGKFQPGNKAGKGRPKGVPNKVTADMKAAIHEAFEKLGGVDWLVSVGREQPQLLMPLLGKVIPTGVQVSGDPESPIVTRTEVVLVRSPHSDS